MYRVVPSQSSWTPTEVQCLQRELAKYPEDTHVRLASYVQVAAALKHKTVRDVAAKVAQMRGAFSQASVAPTTVQTRYLSSLPPHMRAVAAASATPTSTQGSASPSSSLLQPSVVNTLLAENATLLRTMRTNVQSTSMDANIPLMCKFRDNVHAVMDWLHSVPPAMPALPVELDTQLLPPSPRNVYKPSRVFGSGTSGTAAAASGARSGHAAATCVPMQSPIQPAGARGTRMFRFGGEVQHGLGNGSGSAAASSGQP